MFRPNNTGILRRFVSYDVYGTEIYASPTSVPCGVVRLVVTSEKTSVRTDSSGSGSSAEETLITSKILFRPTVSPKREDLFEIAGSTLRIIGVHPRFSVLGDLDHFECDLVRHELEEDA